MPRFWRKKSKPISAPTRVARVPQGVRGPKIIKQIKKGCRAVAEALETRREQFLPANFSIGEVVPGRQTPSTWRPSPIDRAATRTTAGEPTSRSRRRAATCGEGKRGRSSPTSMGIHDPQKTHQGRRRETPFKDKDGKQTVPTGSPAVHVPLEAAIHVVFNVEQAERLKLQELPEKPEAAPAWEAHDAAERVIRASGVDFRHVRRRSAPNTNPARDRIVTMPDRVSSSRTPGRLLPDRLARARSRHRPRGPDEPRERSKTPNLKPASRLPVDYAKEELRAEISSMMTNTRTRTSATNPRHGSAYVSSTGSRHLEEQPQRNHARRPLATLRQMSAYMH